MSGRIICADAANGWPKDTGPVQLVVTSPPYNVGIEYDNHDDTMKPSQWKGMITKVLMWSWDSLEVGGRMCVNVQHESGRNPAVPIGMWTQQILESLPGAQNRGAIVWDKGAAAGGGSRTSWGSWMSPSNPVLRGEYEMIYVYSKDSPQLDNFMEAVPDIKRDEFLAASKDVWRDTGATSNEIRRADGVLLGTHPAPFPVKLAQRLIQFYSFPGQMVLDPFFGSGTTGLAAEELGRDWIGVDISHEYCEMAAKRIALFEGMEVKVEEL